MGYLFDLFVSFCLWFACQVDIGIDFMIINEFGGDWNTPHLYQYESTDILLMHAVSCF